MSTQSLRLALILFAMSIGCGAAASAVAGSSLENPYSPTVGHAYRHGVVPTIGTLRKMRSWASSNSAVPLVVGAKTLIYGGGVDGIGVTSYLPKVYLVVFGTQWGNAGTDSNGNMTLSGDPKGVVPRLQQLFKGLGTGGELWSGTMTQYCDGPLVAHGATSCPPESPHVRYPRKGVLAGVWYDNSGPSPAAANGNQLANEAIRAAAHFGNTTAFSNRYSQYVILSPTGTDPDNYMSDGFCAWHDYNGDTILTGGPAASSYGDIAFTNLPYITDVGAECGANFVNGGTAGALDGMTIVGGHEYAETITDQNPLGGWSNYTTGTGENADECAWIPPGQSGGAANVTMGNGAYAMQSTWSNDTNGCAISHPIVTHLPAALGPVADLLLH